VRDEARARDAGAPSDVARPITRGDDVPARRAGGPTRVAGPPRHGATYPAFIARSPASRNSARSSSASGFGVVNSLSP